MQNAKNIEQMGIYTAIFGPNHAYLAQNGSFRHKYRILCDYAHFPESGYFPPFQPILGHIRALFDISSPIQG